MSVYEHPDYLSLLAAVKANPSDRLAADVLADWLDERGEHETAGLWRSGFIPRVLQVNLTTSEAVRGLVPALAKLSRSIASLDEMLRRLPPVG